MHSYVVGGGGGGIPYLMCSGGLEVQEIPRKACQESVEYMIPCIGRGEGISGFKKIL